jgi:probable DNA repair protein
VWATPAIEDWDTWVRGQWQAQTLAEADAPLLLTSLQERSVWTRMQREDAVLLVSPPSMAALAESGYALLSAYEAHSERSHAWGKTDSESFRQWAAYFDRECVRRNWMPRAGLESRIGASLNPKTLPQEVLLVGFDRTTSAQDGLLRALAACGVQVEFAEDGFHPQPEFIRAAGLREEIAACAWWARAQVEKNSEARVGILVPDMSAMRCEIERTFRRVLMPKTDDVFAAEAMPFEFSLGQPLAHVPAIRAALLLLRWLHAPLLEEEVSWLLLSGFLFSSSVEYLALAKLDAKLRNAGSLSLEIALPAFLKRLDTRRLPSLAKLESVQRAAVASRVAEDDRLPGRWVDLTQSLLRDTGWPGAADRGTFYFQALRRWERALDEVAMLDFDGQRVGYRDFLQMLEAHALETVFSPESQGAPVQIMGALESSGQQFDALWFLSVDDGKWPQRGRPHPLLPNDVQRRFRMPYSDAESDLELAKAFTARIATSAPVVVFSHAERDQDGELRSSPLLPQNVGWKAVRPLPTPIDHMTEGLEEVEDASGSIAWPVDRSAGGSEVLSDQAACPFRAFAKKRLRAEELNRNDWGLSAAERGKLLHKALEKVWSPSEGALHSLDDLQSAIREGRLAGILTSAITKAFAKLDAMDDPWIRAYLMGEQRRLQLRLEEWMRIEAGRMPFEVIGCEEQLSGVGVGNLKLNLRADRIDQVDSFRRLLIDYKTGVVSPNDWKPPRPGDPQLPLYAVFGEVEDLRGVLFARILAGKNCFSGCVTDEAPQPFAETKRNAAFIKDPYTETMRDEWEIALLVLAEEFLRGEAAVNPKEGKKTCEYCPLPGLCRVAETRSLLEEKFDADGNDSDD